MNVNLSQAVLRQLEEHPRVLEALDSVGGQMADVARVNAPRRTGLGANSITHEIVVEQDGPHVHVSWTEDRYYMAFQEFGTSKMNAHPFLRLALDRRYDA